MFPKETEAQAKVRIAERLFGAHFVRETFVKNAFIEDERGTFLHLIHLVELDRAEGIGGSWYLAENLPEDIVVHHREIVAVALAAYKRIYAL